LPSHFLDQVEGLGISRVGAHDEGVDFGSPHCPT
jgi:hypothetical protein